MGLCVHCTGMQAGKVLVIRNNLVHFPGNKLSFGRTAYGHGKNFLSVTITTFMIFFWGGVILRIINFFMFIKRKKNRSGTVSIVVAEKISGYHKEFTIHIFN